MPLIILLSSLTIFSIFLSFFEVFQLDFSFNRAGLIYLLTFFLDFKNLYASTIAVISFYYWIFQMDNIEKSNTRFEEEKIDTKREYALIESRYFHTTIQPIIRKLFDLILEKDKSLFDYKWSYDIFTDESVHLQNSEWEDKFEAIEIFVKKEVNAVNFELDSIAANILHGNIDRELAFNLIGKPFCNQIKSLYPFIAGYRSENRKSDFLNNIVELFNEWNPKIVD